MSTRGRVQPRDQVAQLIKEALAIEAQDAKEAGALGFMARALVQATLPHSKPDTNEFERRNGAFTLTMMAPSKVGLPYGVVPRLVLAWLSTEAVKTRSRELVLGDTLSEFMADLDMVPTGGRWGSITRLREQSRKLFTTSITCLYDGKDQRAGAGFMIADNHLLWWHPQNADQRSLFQSTVTLSEPFFQEIVSNPVPIDMRALRALKKSPMALDIYCWITYRASYLKRPTAIPWEALQLQFGASYPETTRGRLDFKKKFLVALRKVSAVYGALAGKVQALDHQLLLLPTSPHVRRR